jgi:hypothetical protein
MVIKGTSLDTRLQHCMLLEPRLQRRLTGDEFRAFINLMVWVVSLVSDGAFRPDDAEMIPNLEPEHIARFVEMGMVECDDEGNYRIHEDYRSWQTSRADLEKQDDKRVKDRERKKEWRDRNGPSDDTDAAEDDWAARGKAIVDSNKYAPTPMRLDENYYASR